MRPSQIEAVERQRRNWRIGLITIIIITIPFYCVGIFLWGTAPQRDQAANTPVVTQQPTDIFPATATVTPIGGVIASVTPLPITIQPTDFTFPTDIPTAVIPTRFLSPTPTIIIPTNPPPTNVPPPTQPLITDTPLPFLP